MWPERQWCVRALAVAVVLATAACATQARDPFAAVEQANERCRAEGGTAYRAGHFLWGCQWPAADAGKVCNDTDQCEGRCVPPTRSIGEGDDAIVTILTPQTPADALTGTCSAMRTRRKDLNCAVHLRKGQLTIESCYE